MPNKENIEPYTLDKRSKEVARKIQKKGGKARVKQKKEQKTFKELASQLFKMQAPEKVRKKIQEQYPHLSDKQITSKMASLIMLYAKTLKGDVHAFEVLRDTAGEKPDTLFDNDNVDKIKIIIIKGRKK